MEKQELQDFFIYSLHSGNYLRKIDAGCTAAETIRKDFDCPHDEEAGCAICMQQCEDAVRSGYGVGELTFDKIKEFEKEHGRLIIECGRSPSVL